ncbi:MAG: hypothetical protein KJ697_04180 [Nanoarchaeota archaeon]|nr:hypothetical protein [Nanoarchaeota archaeon]
MALDMAMLTNMGLPEILLWLLSFAVFYGVLSQVKMPENRESRAIISIVAAFFVLLATPTSLIEVLSGMSSSLILVVLGLLILMIFMEIAGIKHKEPTYDIDQKTGKATHTGFKDIPLLAHHKYAAFAVFLIIAVLIFMSSGGMELLGFPAINMSSSGMTSIVFFIVIILAIVWMIGQKAK